MCSCTHMRKCMRTYRFRTLWCGHEITGSGWPPTKCDAAHGSWIYAMVNRPHFPGTKQTAEWSVHVDIEELEILGCECVHSPSKNIPYPTILGSDHLLPPSVVPIGSHDKCFNLVVYGKSCTRTFFVLKITSHLLLFVFNEYQPYNFDNGERASYARYHPPYSPHPHIYDMRNNRSNDIRSNALLGHFLNIWKLIVSIVHTYSHCVLPQLFLFFYRPWLWNFMNSSWLWR
jgi:hypothetical protein